MYSELAINTLLKQIGWSDVLSSGLPISIDEDLKFSESGRIFESFHPLVNLENIYASVLEKLTEEEKFNSYLVETAKNNVLSVLNKIMNQNVNYIDSFDYDAIIEAKKNLFVEAIGYSVACQMVELFLSTSRKNFFERNAKDAVVRLKMDLEGAKNERGHKIAYGLKDQLRFAVNNASDIIFPQHAVVDSKRIW